MEVMEKLSDFKNKVLCMLKREKDEFKRMSKAEKRVAIAQDVIAQIKCENYVPESGTYVEIDASSKAYKQDKDIDDLLNKPADLMLQEGMLQCTVCAKGAMFMSHIRKDSRKCTVDNALEGGDESTIEERLTDVFSEQQLDLIEAAFESNTDFYDRNGYSDKNEGDVSDIAEKAADFGDKYSTDQRRLMAIMKNIIKNEGTFIPN